MLDADYSTLSSSEVKSKRGYTSAPWTGIAQSISRLATGWAVRGSNLGGGEILSTRPDLPYYHPAFCTMGTGSLSRGSSGRDVPLTTHSYLASRLKKEYSYTSAPPLGHHGLFYGELYLIYLCSYTFMAWYGATLPPCALCVRASCHTVK